MMGMVAATTDSGTASAGQNPAASAFHPFHSALIPKDQEAPPSIFQTSVASSDVELFLQGSWEATLSGSFGFGFKPGMGAYPLSSGSPFLFSQVPDLTLSLWLMKRYFFEASFLDGYQLNTFLLGYEGKGNEPLQYVHAGNTSIDFPDYDHVPIAASPAESPGVLVGMQSPISQHQLLVRYDGVKPTTKRFVGKNEDELTEIEPGSYLAGRFFLLPDADIDSGSLVLYEESSSGTYLGQDSRKYRKLTISGTTVEADVSYRTGEIALKTAAAGRVLAYYTKNGKEVGSSGLGAGALSAVDSSGGLDPDGTAVDFSFSSSTYLGRLLSSYEVGIGTQGCVILSDPGRFSPFEEKNRYTAPTGMTNYSYHLSVVDLGAGSAKITSIGVQALKASLNDSSSSSGIASSVGTSTTTATSTTETFILAAAKSANGDIRDPRFRYPFAAKNPRLYLPASGGTEAFESRKILADVLKPVTAFYLDSDTVAGTINVTWNGETEKNFTYDKNTHALNFLRSVGSSDVIVVSYLTIDSARTAGNIAAALGNRFQISPDTSAFLALATRWNLGSSTYTKYDDESPGALTLAGGVNWAPPGYSVKTTAYGTYGNPDTTGKRRLLGMEDNGVELSLSIPGPRSTADTTDVPREATAILDDQGKSLTTDTRGTLIYKDFRSYDTLGNATLMSLGWSIPSSQVYDPSVRRGPYTALDNETDSSKKLSGELMVMDYQVAASEKWVSAVRPLSTAEAATLADTQSIGVFFKLEDSTGASKGDLELHLQAGRLNYPNIASSFTEDSDTILDIPLFTDFSSSSSAENAWQINTTPLSSADRQKLGSATALRFVLLRKAGSVDAAGKILFSPVTVNSTSFGLASAPAGASITSREMSESEIALSGGAVPVGGFLPTKFPDVSKVFHPDGSSNKVLETTWDLPFAGKVSMSRLITSSKVADYRAVSFYLRRDATVSGSPNLTVTLSGGSTKSTGVISVTLPLSSEFDTWRKVTAVYAGGKKTVYLDGNTSKTLAGTTVTDSGAETATVVTLAVASSDLSSGKFYMDELCLESSAGYVEAGGDVTFTLNRTGPLVKVSGFPVVSNLDFKETAAGAVQTPVGVVGTSIPSYSFDTNTGADLVGSRVQTDVILAGESGSFAPSFISHLVRIPSSAPLQVQDIFQLDYQASTYNREDSLKLPLLENGNLTLTQTAKYVDEVMAQTWKTSFSQPVAVSSFSLVTDLENDIPASFAPNAQDYGASWKDSYWYFLPKSEAEATQRSGAAQAGFKLPTTPVGFAIDSKSSLLYDASATPIQTDSAEYKFSFPLQVGEEMTLTPGYERKLDISRTGVGLSSIRSSLQAFSSDLAAQPYFYRSVPFAELYTSSDRLGFSSASSVANFPVATDVLYVPKLSLAMDRPIGSRPLDLVVPVSGTVSVERDFERLDDNTSTFNAYRISTKTGALNLFGEQGSYPLVSFYSTDEFYSLVDAGISVSTGGSVIASDLLLQDIATFYGEDDDKFTSDNRLTLNSDGTVADTLKLSLSLRARKSAIARAANAALSPLASSIDGKTGSPYLAKIFSAQPVLKNIETLEGGYSRSTSAKSASLGFKHETQLGYTERFTTSAYGLFDYAIALPPSARVATLNIEVGLTMKLSF